MNLKDLTGMALSNLKRHKSRTFLTILGIVIGTISIIMMIALGLGMQESFASTIENMGSVDIITVTKGDSTTSTTRSSEQNTDDELTNLDLEFFQTLDYIEAVSPVIKTNVKLVSGEYEATSQLVGLEFELLEIMGYEFSETQEIESNRIGLVFGQTAAESFSEVVTSSSTGDSGFGGGFGKFGGGAPSDMGDRGGGPPGMDDEEEEEEEELDVDIFSDRISMSLDTSYSPMNKSSSSSDVYRIQATALLEEGDNTRDRSIYIDIEELAELIEDYELEEVDGFDEVYLKVVDTSYVEDIVDYLEEYGYSTSTSAEMVETIESTTSMLQIALGAIGGIALLVAAIGITNTMIMAITERKKEIGVMKVIGATIIDIKRLFLLEAAIIGFMGGIVGISLCYGLTTIITSSSFGSMTTGGGLRGGGMNSIMSLNFQLPMWLIGAGVVFTTIVGLVSGYMPARKAMRSSALEALHAD